MGAGLCKDCFGAGGGSPEVPVPRRSHGSGHVAQADRVRDYRSTQSSAPRSTGGAQHSSGPTHDQVRANAAAAAEARLKSDQARGLKNPSEFQRLQERQARIEKAEEEAARKGQFDNRGGLKWQMN